MSETYWMDLKGRKHKEMAPGVRTRTFWKKNMLTSLVDIDPNCVAALHTHVEEQVGFVTKGTVEMTIAGETRLMKEGEMYHVPANVPHGAKAGPKGAQILDVFAPIRSVLQY